MGMSLVRAGCNPAVSYAEMIFHSSGECVATSI